jgi:hypothetical protein
MFNIFEEIPWSHFQHMPGIKIKPITEQVQNYNQYLYQLGEARINWLIVQPKGANWNEATPTGGELWNEATTFWEDALGTWNQ